MSLQNGSLPIEGATPAALQSMAREATEARAMVEAAQTFPRNEAQAFLSLMGSCKRPAFADMVAYSFPRGGQRISGPTVDLAREAARCWGNLTYGIRIISTEGDEVHIQGWAWDMQTNARVTVEDKFRRLVQRKAKDSQGRPTGETLWVEPDERDLRELINRRGALAERNAILKVLPGDLIDDALGQAHATLEMDADEALQANRDHTVKHVVTNFDTLGATPAMLEQYLGHPLKSVTADELADLRRVYKSLRDKHTRLSEHFDVADTQGSARKAEEMTEAVKGRGRPGAAPQKEEPARQGKSPEYLVCPDCNAQDPDCKVCEGTGEVLEEVAS